MIWIYKYYVTFIYWKYKSAFVLIIIHIWKLSGQFVLIKTSYKVIAPNFWFFPRFYNFKNQLKFQLSYLV